MDVNFIPEDQYSDFINQGEETAYWVSQTSTKVQSLTITFHGPRSGEKKKLDYYTDLVQIEGTSPSILMKDRIDSWIDEPIETAVRENEIINITPKSRAYSYILNGLVRNRVVITGKINHLLIRDCFYLTLNLYNGTISGLDILRGSEINIQMPAHTSTNLEYVDRSSIQGDVTSNSRITIDRSLNINLNHQEIGASPFVRITFNENDNQKWEKQSAPTSCSSDLLLQTICDNK